jgi:hypothetical protein
VSLSWTPHQPDALKAEAAMAGSHAVRLAGDTHSSLVIDWLIRFDRNLTERYPRQAETVGFHEQLREYVRRAAPPPGIRLVNGHAGPCCRRLCRGRAGDSQRRVRMAYGAIPVIGMERAPRLVPAACPIGR